MLNGYKDITYVPINSASGDLYFAKRIADGLEVAIKVNKDGSKSSSIRFKRENDILHDLMTHENIIEPITRILNTTSLGNVQVEYYVMKKASSNLERWLYEDRAKIIQNKLNIFKQICIGLKYAHGKGYSHRDLHTGNILIEHKPVDTVKLIDFGRAYDFNTRLLLSSAAPFWGMLVMPPEVRFGTIANPDSGIYIKGDIFALGLIWAFLFNASSDPVRILSKIDLEMYEFMDPDIPYDEFKPYYQNTTIEQRAERFEKWLALNNLKATTSFDVKLLDVSLGDELSIISRKLISFDPSNRYESIDEVLIEVERHIIGGKV